MINGEKVINVIVFIFTAYIILLTFAVAGILEDYELSEEDKSIVYRLLSLVFIIAIANNPVADHFLSQLFSFVFDYISS